MKHIKNDEWLIHTQGLSKTDDDLTVYLGKCQCGDIKDGIAFDIRGFGAWVVSRGEVKHLAQELGLIPKEG